MSRPLFFSEPLRFLRWASHEKPAIFYSMALGTAGVTLPFFVPRIRYKYLNDPRPERIPQTYPIPTGPRKIPEGYDDPLEKESS